MLRKNMTSGSMRTAGINFLPKQNEPTPIIQIKEEPQIQEESIFRPKPTKKAKLKYHRDK
jgi:hypothetical protein